MKRKKPESSYLINVVAAIVLLFSSIVSSEQTQNWYQVEVIIFEYTRPDLDGEVWFNNPGLPNLDTAIELLTEEQVLLQQEINEEEMEEAMELPLELEQESDTVQEEESEQDPIAYLKLSEQHYQLQNSYRIFKLASDYKPLIHVSWQQPGIDGTEAKPVHLEKAKGEEYFKSTPELSEFNMEEIFLIKKPETVIDGTIRLRSGLYLHVDVDFVYFPEDMMGILVNQKGIRDMTEDERGQYINADVDYVRLKESRRIKLNELHYFDHPLFGVVLQVSRLQFDNNPSQN